MSVALLTIAELLLRINECPRLDLQQKCPALGVLRSPLGAFRLDHAPSPSPKSKNSPSGSNFLRSLSIRFHDAGL